MYCSYCGSYVNEGSKFCENCGNKINKKQTTKQQKPFIITKKVMTIACFVVLLSLIVYGTALVIMNFTGIPAGHYCSIPISNYLEFEEAYNGGAYSGTDIFFVDFRMNLVFNKSMDISKLPVEGTGFVAPMLYEVSEDTIHIWTDPEYEEEGYIDVLVMDEYFDFKKEPGKLFIGNTWFYKYHNN